MELLGYYNGTSKVLLGYYRTDWGAIGGRWGVLGMY